MGFADARSAASALTAVAQSAVRTGVGAPGDSRWRAALLAGGRQVRRHILGPLPARRRRPPVCHVAEQAGQCPEGWLGLSHGYSRYGGVGIPTVH
ncbi:hypothetical protein [Micromonospora gifhornensis]|uniref:hypothetical protein n=1 Tax=Micromonospora gifhornensis TaxID=84594 RepID=UPI003D72A680